ncbi:MAG: uncharacterized protein JWP07_4722 [Pseudonocardiales bacterium]|nr:uncharacterized protein [Pseudonocardiales bacterium]
MTTPPPYAGKTAGQAETPSSEFGATTVSGKPSNGHSADTDPTSPAAPTGPSPVAPATAKPATASSAAPAPLGAPRAAHSAPTVTPGAARRTPPPVRPGPTTGGAAPTTARPGTLPGLGSPVPGRGAPLPGVNSPVPGPPPVNGSGAPPLGGPTFAPAPNTGPAPTAGPAPKPGRADAARGPRRARLQLRHIDPWTVLKFSCVLSIALFFVWLIVIGVLFGILDAAGVVGKINDSVTLINGAGSKAPVTAGIVFGGAAIIGVINIVLFIALSTIGSVVYNLCADLVGGIELTLSER